MDSRQEEIKKSGCLCARLCAETKLFPPPGPSISVTLISALIVHLMIPHIGQGSEPRLSFDSGSHQWYPDVDVDNRSIQSSQILRTPGSVNLWPRTAAIAELRSMGSPPAAATGTAGVVTAGVMRVVMLEVLVVAGAFPRLVVGGFLALAAGVVREWRCFNCLRSQSVSDHICT